MERFTTIVESARGQLGNWIIHTVAVFILLFLFFVAGGGVSQNDKWRIENIEVVGAKAVSPEAIRDAVKEELLGNYFFVYARENIYLYPRQEIERGLLDIFPRLARVSVIRTDVHSILVTVSERKPYALWCGENFLVPRELFDCWFIDSMGFVFDKAPVFSNGVYMEMYGKLVEKNVGSPLRGSLPNNRFMMVDSFVKLFHNEVGELLRINLKPEGDIDVTVGGSVIHPFLNGATVRLRDEQIPAILIKNLLLAIPVQFPENVALKKKLLYIDMRFGNKIFFGFEN